MLKTILKYFIPISIIAVAGGAIFVITSTPPDARRGPRGPAAKVLVEVQEIVPAPYDVVVESYGTVRPRTQSSLTSQVSGQITFVSEAFREGGFFARGDVLLRLDQRDYVAQLRVAEADLILARQSVVEETARAEQAEEEWRRLGQAGRPSDLVLRIPQLESARASQQSAEARLRIAQLALERTEIKAPYDGRVLTKYVDVGQVVVANTSLADIYATDYVEVRLPINNRDLPLLPLPEEAAGSSEAGTLVLLDSDLIGEQQWQGRLVRTEGAIDSNSQQLFAVAQIDRPFEGAAPFIKIGQYVTASVVGRAIAEVIRIPNRAIYQGQYVDVEEGSLIFRRDVSILWQNDEDALIASGLGAGENLVVSPLGNVASGTAVNVAGREQRRRQQ